MLGVDETSIEGDGVLIGRDNALTGRNELFVAWDTAGRRESVIGDGAGLDKTLMGRNKLTATCPVCLISPDLSTVKCLKNLMKY